jgi:dTDP-4-amino-4,6-dideoxygalactose transaminase
MTDIQAALGLSQLTKLDTFIHRRNELADRYRALLAPLPVELPPEAPQGFTHGYHLFAVRVRDRERVFNGLRSAGIGVQVHYVPVHHHPISVDMGLAQANSPHATKRMSNSSASRCSRT